MSDFIFYFMLYGVPVISVLLFILSISRYRQAVKQNNAEPGAFSVKELRKRRIIMYVTGVVAVVTTAYLIGIIMLTFAIMVYM